jgi:hypothetical protein
MDAFLICFRGGCLMKIAEHLSDEQKQQLKNLKSPKKKHKQEKVNWKEIMGMNRDVYTRRNGAVRRK